VPRVLRSHRGRVGLAGALHAGGAGGDCRRRHSGRRAVSRAANDRGCPAVGRDCSMIPLKDDVPSRSTPIITILLIALNVAAYVYQLSLGLTAEAPGRAASEALVLEFGATPCRLTGLCDRGDFPSPYVTIFTSMFLHGSPLHIAGNMLYLWIFGDN